MDSIDDLLSFTEASLLSSAKLKSERQESKQNAELISLNEIPSARSEPPEMSTSNLFDSNLSPKSVDTENAVCPTNGQKRKNASLFDLLDPADIYPNNPDSTTPRNQEQPSSSLTKSRSLIDLLTDEGGNEKETYVYIF